jgi:hypothetical protein
MREIKFRAWDKETKTMQYNVSFLYNNAEIMQFTGILDKNGKEIYEGDIVKRGTTISDIIWEDYGFKLRKGNSICDVNKPIEIIGNIYESPELLTTH